MKVPTVTVYYKYVAIDNVHIFKTKDQIISEKSWIFAAKFSKHMIIILFIVFRKSTA